nr:hypothetical protein SHINE37_20034 [Rhizobiaceae bacterium]
MDGGQSFAGPCKNHSCGAGSARLNWGRVREPSNLAGSEIQKRQTAANGRALFFYALCFCSK